MGRYLLGAAGLCGALVLACGAEPSATTPTDAGADVVKRKPDAGPRDAGSADVDPRLDRMTSGGGPVLGAMKLGIVDIGIDETEGSPSFDDYVTWLVSSSWWAIMKQYGVGPGTVVGSVRVPKASVFQPSDVDGKGIAYWSTVDWRVDTLLKATGDGGAPIVQKADAYIVFLPWGVNVDVGGVTCDTVGG